MERWENVITVLKITGSREEAKGVFGKTRRRQSFAASVGSTKSDLTSATQLPSVPLTTLTLETVLPPPKVYMDTRPCKGRSRVVFLNLDSMVVLSSSKHRDDHYNGNDKPKDETVFARRRLF